MARATTTGNSKPTATEAAAPNPEAGTLAVPSVNDGQISHPSSVDTPTAVPTADLITPPAPIDQAPTPDIDPAAATITVTQPLVVASDLEEEADNEITLYPIRSYLDGEIRRAGGEGYKSPRHDAVALIAAGLATDKKPQA